MGEGLVSGSEGQPVLAADRPEAGDGDAQCAGVAGPLQPLRARVVEEGEMVRGFRRLHQRRFRGDRRRLGGDGGRLVPAAGGEAQQGGGQQDGSHRGSSQSLVRSDHSSGKQRRCRVSVR